MVDIEASGQHQTKNEMMAIGACIGDSKTGEIIDEFQVFLKPHDQDDIHWEQRSLDEFWDKHPDIKKEVLNKISSVGLSPNEAMIQFHNWINDKPPDVLKDMIIMTDTAGFDIGFLNYYLSFADMPSMNYIIGGKYRPIRDASSFHMGVGMQLPCDGLWDAESAALKRLNATLPDNPYTFSHLPVDDAKCICWQIMQIHKLIKKSISS